MIDNYLEKFIINSHKNKNFIKLAIEEVVNLSKKDKPDAKIILISDKNIWQNCKKYFVDYPKIYKIDKFLLKEPIADEFFLETLLQKSKNYDFIIALGSGTVSDLCKIVATKLEINFVTFASAASMNAYLSRNASIKINGHKKTIPAKLPLKVFCDLEIIKNAPQKLTKAGIGDAMCFYSCWFDWFLSHKLLDYNFDKKPFLILKDKMDFLVKNYQKYSFEDLEFYQIIIEILLISGIGMTICGSSNPASQSEHLIAHTIDMKYPAIALNNLHGQTIAVTLMTVVKIQQQILENFNEFYQKLKDFNINQEKHHQQRIIDFFGEEAGKESILEYEQKLNKIKLFKDKNLTESQLQNLKKELAKILLSEPELQKIFDYFQIQTNAKSLNLNDQQYQKCVENAKFIRNRFGCIDGITQSIN